MDKIYKSVYIILIAIQIACDAVSPLWQLTYYSIIQFNSIIHDKV